MCFVYIFPHLGTQEHVYSKYIFDIYGHISDFSDIPFVTNRFMRFGIMFLPEVGEPRATKSLGWLIL